MTPAPEKLLYISPDVMTVECRRVLHNTGYALGGRNNLRQSSQRILLDILATIVSGGSSTIDISAQGHE
jgi:hypothetical protein